MMDYIVIKSLNSICLVNGNTVYICIYFKPSVNNKDKITDIGVEIEVNKSCYHSRLMPIIHQLASEAEEEVLRLNSEFRGKSLSTFTLRDGSGLS